MADEMEPPPKQLPQTVATLSRFRFGGLCLLLAIIMFAIQQGCSAVNAPPSWIIGALWFAVVAMLLVAGIWCWDQTSKRHWIIRTLLSVICVAGVSLASYKSILKQYKAELTSAEMDDFLKKLSRGDAEITYRDDNRKTLPHPSELTVEDYDIIDSQTGFMKVRVSQAYLNTRFSSKRTLSYGRREYEPLLLTFSDDAQLGPGVIISSPEPDRNSRVFIDQCIRFEGFGPKTYTSDMVFTLYYKGDCVYFAPEVSFSFLNLPDPNGYKPPPIRYGAGEVCLSYFSTKASHVCQPISEVEEYFRGRTPPVK